MDTNQQVSGRKKSSLDKVSEGGVSLYGIQKNPLIFPALYFLPSKSKNYAKSA
jgi:hypothetical protein